MLLIYAILFILFEAISEGLIKKNCPNLSKVIFVWWLQWIIAFALFGVWFFFVALDFKGYYVPMWKMICGFVFVRLLIFDVAWNLSAGQQWDYYGTTKLYDRIMFALADWGWFMKCVAGAVGIVFLLGWS